MPLSEHEQRLLDQIERALYAEDPKFASTVRGGRMRPPTKRRRVQGFALFAVGLVMLVLGVALPMLWLGSFPVLSVVGFLVISFAIWGIGDIFRGFGLSSLAKVGSTEISVEQFRRAYNDKLQDLGRRMRRPITAEQARALGLERQIVGQMIAEASLDERARELRLNLSDAEIARQITGDPTFQGPNGTFDKLDAYLAGQ